MNRNDEIRFSQAPQVNIQRSSFPMHQNIKTTFNMGDLIPFFVDSDILPGDTMKYDFSAVIRQSTPIYPTMDNSFLDIYFYAIPWRLVWEHTKEFFGENKKGAWVQQTEYVIPQLTTPREGANKGTIMDYMGIPTKVGNLSFSALPIRAYILTYNEHFRDQNLIAPVTEYTDDTDRTANNTTPELGGLPLKAARLHDYFSSCLPNAQKGEAISLPIGESAVVEIDISKDNTENYLRYAMRPDTGQKAGLYTSTSGGGDINSGLGQGINTVIITNNESKLIGTADLANAVAATINAQRLAFATQRILEKDARGGTRYAEMIKAHFGVTSPDARQQRPEYLGGKRIPITMQQVAQTSSTDSTSPQGNLSAFSHTSDSDRMFTKSFTEHTIILGLAVVRQEHSYQQGLNRMWSRRRRLDTYFPALAHLGEQAVLNKEIFAVGKNDPQSTQDEETFGFQERWAEYRYKPNIITGAFRSNYNQSLDSWHYGDDYADLPGLNQKFIEETKEYLDRTLAVQSNVEDQYLMDALVSIKATRPMPLRSIPGMLDHF